MSDLLLKEILVELKQINAKLGQSTVDNRSQEVLTGAQQAFEEMLEG